MRGPVTLALVRVRESEPVALVLEPGRSPDLARDAVPAPEGAATLASVGDPVSFYSATLGEGGVEGPFVELARAPSLDLVEDLTLRSALVSAVADRFHAEVVALDFATWEAEGPWRSAASS